MIRPSEILAQDCSRAVNPNLQRLETLRNSTLVVLGGTGFLGKWIAETVCYLNDKKSFGIECHLIGLNPQSVGEDAPHLLTRKDLNFVRGDVRYLNELPRESSYVIHAAATPDNRAHSTNPTETMTTIAEGTANVLRLVGRCSNLRMMLNVSSGLVYGSIPLDMKAVPESYSGSVPCSDPMSAYTEAKRFAETLCAATRTQNHVPLVSVRPFSFVGPYQSLETPWAINNFLRDALHGNAIKVLGNGQTVRSYMHGSEFAAWALTIMAGTKPGKTYNIGSEEALTIEQAARLVASHCNPAPDILIGSSINSYPTVSRFVPDTNNARQDFGLKTEYSAAQAILRTLEWHRARISNL